jgi:hypothetical protein
MIKVGTAGKSKCDLQGRDLHLRLGEFLCQICCCMSEVGCKEGHNELRGGALYCREVQYSGFPSVQGSAVQYSEVQCIALQCGAVQCIAVHSRAVQYTVEKV